MPNEILSYEEMCEREGVIRLQRGMNFGIGGHHSTILMSLRSGAFYKDEVQEEGKVLIYEGHDAPRSRPWENPKLKDQPEYLPTGTLSQNGKFHKAAQDFKRGLTDVERVRVYEKIKKGIWSYNGVFHLVDSFIVGEDGRMVFKFNLAAVEEDDFALPPKKVPEFRRIIPTWVKVDVWKRDKGKCVICQSVCHLHFDHIIPFSKGGSSTTPQNIQILCDKHNLQKHDHII